MVLEDKLLVLGPGLSLEDQVLGPCPIEGLNLGPCLGVKAVVLGPGHDLEPRVLVNIPGKPGLSRG